jgi:universal stress protein A
VSVAAQWTNGRISVIHAAENEQAVKHANQKLNGLIADFRRNGLEAEGLCLSGDPLEVLLSHAAQWRADVIAVGTQGKGGLARLLPGSVAEGLLRRAGCPVLIVRNAAPLVRTAGRHARRHTD